jgi:hypothetical protein
LRLSQLANLRVFTIRYLMIQPVWETLKTTALYPILNVLLPLLAALGNREFPFD